MEDLVNLRLQKQKQSWYILKHYPMIWIGSVLLLIGLSGDALSCYRSDNLSTITISDGMFLVIFALITSIVIFALITSIGLFLIIIAVAKIDQNRFYDRSERFSDDSLYRLLFDRVFITPNGYFVPDSPDTSLLYLMLNRLLQYDLNFEFETFKDGDTKIITGVSKKHQSQVTLTATLVDATDVNLYKNVRLTLNEKNN